MRRLSKAARAILGGGVFLVLAAILLMGYFQQGEEQDRLSMELSAVQILLAKQWDKFTAEELPENPQLLSFNDFGKLDPATIF